MKRGIILLAWVLAGCGGGGSASDSGNNSASDSDAAAVVAASLSAKPLAGNQASLALAGAPAGRYCIRQVTEQPLASDSCFSDQLQQVQTIANPSDTARATFTAWVLSNTGTVSRHASVSLPGKTCSAAAYAAIAASSLPAVCIITSAGESVLTLEPVKAPVSTANFLRYVNQGFYDQTVFHRFFRGSLNFVQGGGFTHSNGSYVTKNSALAPIALESTVQTGLRNESATIAMARTSDPDSATAGFFVNTGANTGFNSTTTRDGYAVFGQVVHGTSAWSSLLTTAVPGSGEVQNPASPLWLRWAYQIQ
jgi:peptidyl-prolyl cis-trans isomerase A (cyclophilin A)